jgi:hypothetical protein
MSRGVDEQSPSILQPQYMFVNIGKPSLKSAPWELLSNLVWKLKPANSLVEMDEMQTGPVKGLLGYLSSLLVVLPVCHVQSDG